jgi:hypothetical protein
MLPQLQMSSLKTRINQATSIYHSNLKFFDRLQNIKSTVPSYEVCEKNHERIQKMKKRLSKFDVKPDLSGEVDTSYKNIPTKPIKNPCTQITSKTQSRERPEESWSHKDDREDHVKFAEEEMEERRPSMSRMKQNKFTSYNSRSVKNFDFPPASSESP